MECVISTYQPFQNPVIVVLFCLVFMIVIPCFIFFLCLASNLYPFGEAAGDITGPQGDDEVSGAISLNTPIIFYFGRENRFFVSFNKEI